MEKLTIQEFPSRMCDLAVDPMHINRTLMHGFFRQEVKTGEIMRPFYTYITEDLEYGQRCLVVAPPADTTDPAAYLETSGLRAFADEEKVFLFLMEARNSAWDLSGKDAAYMNAVYVCAQARDYYITLQDNFYAIGIGDGAAVAHQAVATMSSEWSGVLTVGDLAANLNLYAIGSEKAGLGSNGELQIAAEHSQTPVWIGVSQLTGANLDVVSYWREQNETRPEALSGEGADYIWMPAYVHQLPDINEEIISQVRVTLDQTEFTREFLDNAWRYIGLTARHRGQGKKNLRYIKDPIALGAQKYEMIVDGYARQWFEYVPTVCTPDKTWPVVVMHGRGGTAETFFDLSNMYQVANSRRFIVAVPQASIYQQKPSGLRNVLVWDGIYNGEPVDDVKFIREMLANMQARLPVDSGRIYACGQSSGGMMADTLAKYANDIFAATVSWSGLNFYEQEFMHREVRGNVFPTVIIYGDRDNLFGGHDRVPGLPFPVNPYFIPVVEDRFRRFHLDKNVFDTWETYPITWYSYPNKQGVPMFVAGVVDNMVHANYPEESWITYDQYLSKFRRDADGTLYYCGHMVEK